MKTLSISEATNNLGTWLQQAVAGEDIGIRSGETVVALRPMPQAGSGSNSGRLSPLEALRMLQEEFRGLHDRFWELHEYYRLLSE